MRIPDLCLCKIKCTDQLGTDSTIPLLHKSEITSFYTSLMTAQAGLCQTISEIPKTGFLALRL